MSLILSVPKIVRLYLLFVDTKRLRVVNGDIVFPKTHKHVYQINRRLINRNKKYVF